MTSASWRASSGGASLAVCLAIVVTACEQSPTHVDVVARVQGGVPSAGATTLFIGDNADSAVERIAIPSGDYLGPFVEPGSGGLRSPRGLIFSQQSTSGECGNLLVVDQNADTSSTGEILEYSGLTGEFLGALVPPDSEYAPFAPRGVIELNGVLYVADFGGDGNPGRIATFDATTGAFLGDLSTAGFTGSFAPRSLVVGPDGLLYVTNAPSRTTGQVLIFDPEAGFLRVFIDSETCGCGLANPEGLVFDPRGKLLYVTSFQTNDADNDKILIFDATTGELVDQIDLDVVGAGEPRAFAQALLFGLGGFLYVPITGGDEAFAGELRRYNVHTGTYDVIVPPASEGGPLGAPVYLTFCNTDPATLAYDPTLTGRCCQRL